MVYYKRNVKSVRPTRRYRRKNSKFTRFNTYRNRSAKAQAYQIYALNKKVNGVLRANKPEVQTSQGNCVTDTNGDSYTTVVNQSTDAMMWTVIPPGRFTTFNNKLARVRDIKVYGTLSSEYSLAYPAVLRLIFFQAKKDIVGVPLPSQIVNYVAGNNSEFEKGPLRTGITANYNIVGMKNIVISPSFYRTKTFKIKLTKLYNFRTETAFQSIPIATSLDQQVFPKGSVFCLSLFSNQGFRQSSSDTYPALTLKNFTYKLSYVDQN